jgi:hypothetical protein
MDEGIAGDMETINISLMAQIKSQAETITCLEAVVHRRICHLEYRAREQEIWKSNVDTKIVIPACKQLFKRLDETDHARLDQLGAIMDQKLLVMKIQLLVQFLLEYSGCSRLRSRVRDLESLEVEVDVGHLFDAEVQSGKDELTQHFRHLEEEFHERVGEAMEVGRDKLMKGVGRSVEGVNPVDDCETC